MCISCITSFRHSDEAFQQPRQRKCHPFYANRNPSALAVQPNNNNNQSVYHAGKRTRLSARSKCAFNLGDDTSFENMFMRVHYVRGRCVDKRHTHTHTLWPGKWRRRKIEWKRENRHPTVTQFLARGRDARLPQRVVTRCILAQVSSTRGDLKRFGHATEREREEGKGRGKKRKKDRETHSREKIRRHYHRRSRRAKEQARAASFNALQEKHIAIHGTSRE